MERRMHYIYTGSLLKFYMVSVISTTKLFRQEIKEKSWFKGG